MNTIIHKVMFFLTGGQSGFAFPLSHQWHGINVAPPLYLIAFAGALFAIGLLGYCVWRKVKGRPSVIAFLAMLLSATAAYAASSTLANLSAASAISAGDLFYVVQSGGDFKATGTQLQTWAGTVVQTGPGATGGTCNPGATCTISSQEIPTTITSGNYTSTYYGQLLNYNSASDQSPTLPAASAAGNGTFLDTCSIQHSQTVTPNSSIPDTIGGASSYALPTGTQAAPKCVKLTSDGISNWNPVPYNGAASSGANPTATAGPAAVNGSATTFMRSDASPAVQVGSASQKGIVQPDGASIVANAGTISAPVATPMYVNTTGTFYSVAPVGSASSTAGVAGTVYYYPIWIGQPITIEGIVVRFGTGCAGSGTCTQSFGVGIYATSGNRPTGGALAYGYSSVISTALVTVSLTSPGATYSITAPGWYWVAFQYGDTTERMYNPDKFQGGSALVASLIGSSTSSTAAQYMIGVSQTGTPGTMPTAGSLTEVFSNGGNPMPWFELEISSVP